MKMKMKMKIKMKNDKETITTFTSPTGFQPTSRIKTNFYEIVFKEKFIKVI